jgi:hypothetical protein
MAASIVMKTVAAVNISKLGAELNETSLRQASTCLHISLLPTLLMYLVTALFFPEDFL